MRREENAGLTSPQGMNTCNFPIWIHFCLSQQHHRQWRSGEDPMNCANVNRKVEAKIVCVEGGRDSSPDCQVLN